MALVARSVDTSAQRSGLAEAARLTALLCGFAALVVGVVWLVPSLPREYYFHKYGLSALMLMTSVAPAAVATAWWPERRLSVTAAVAMTICVWIVSADRAATPQRQGYLERSGQREPLRQVAALHDPAIERQVRSVLAATERQSAVLLLPHWPVFNFSDNVVNAWRYAAKRPVKGLQDERWELFLNGPPAGFKGCVFWPAGPRAEARRAAMNAANPRAKVPARIEQWAKEQETRCVAIRSELPDERLCWRCP